MLCAPSKSSLAKAPMLNFLADRGDKGSRSKVKLCNLVVKYLGLIISKGTQRLGEKRIKPIFSFP